MLQNIIFDGKVLATACKTCNGEGHISASHDSDNMITCHVCMGAKFIPTRDGLAILRLIDAFHGISINAIHNVVRKAEGE